MFYKIKVSTIVRIPPYYFDLPLKEAALRVLREEFEGHVEENLGLIIAITDVNVKEEGFILPGDGATYHQAEFEALIFNPKIDLQRYVYEVVEGEVMHVEDFGVFVRLGPIDALIHISQIYDDKFNYNPKERCLVGRDTGYMVKVHDIVRARIIACEIRGHGSILGEKPIKVALTTRQPFLGNIDWIKKELERIYGKSKEVKSK